MSNKRYIRRQRRTAPEPSSIEPPETRPPSEVLDDLWHALQEAYPDTYWRYGGELVVRNGDQLRPVSAPDLAGPLVRAAMFVKGGDEEDDQRPPDAEPKPKVYKAPKAEMRNWLVSDPHGCPELSGVIRTPGLVEGNRLLIEPGYDPETGLWLHWEGEPPDPSQVTHDQIDDVLGRILDLPFATHTDRVHALALYLEPLVRWAIPGASPLWLIEATHEQAGKSYLAKCVGAAALGQFPEERGLDAWSSESSRQLVSYLLAAPSILFLDNLPTGAKLASSDLHRYLTADGPVVLRKLGSSDHHSVLIRTTWIATANLPDMDPEQARRTIAIRLQHEPNRTHKTPRLAHWILENRRLVVSVLLRIVVEWLSAGCPAGTRTLASYESWSDVMGGIMSMVPGAGDHFLSPAARPVMKVHLDLQELFEVWPAPLSIADLQAGIRTAKPQMSKPKDLLPVIERHGLDHLAMAIEGRSKRGTLTKLGAMLKRLCIQGRIIGGWRLTMHRDSQGMAYLPVRVEES